MIAAVAFALEYLAVHLLAGVRASLASATAAAPVLLVGALVCELASLCCYTALTTTVLPGAHRRPYRVLLAIDVAGNGFSRIVPGGGATAAAMRFRLLGRVGVPSEEAVELTALETAVADLWLVAALAIGLFLAVPTDATRPLVRTAAMAAVVLVTAFAGLVAVLMVRPDAMITVTERIARRVPFLRPGRLEHLLRGVITQVRLVLGSPGQRRRIVLWALGNWAFDAASLYLCVLAMGVAPTIGGLVTTYAVAGLLATLPLTPGGLGIVEGVAVPTLVSFGVPHGPALLGVLAWRLFEFWLPIPLALASYVWLRRQDRGSRSLVEKPEARRRVRS